MPAPLPEPVLTLSIGNLAKLTSIDMDDISTIWNVFTKCKDNLENGRRLENISWRLWYRSSHPLPCFQNNPTVAGDRSFDCSHGVFAVANASHPCEDLHSTLDESAAIPADSSCQHPIYLHTPLTTHAVANSQSTTSNTSVRSLSPTPLQNVVSSRSLNRLLSGVNPDTLQLQSLQQLIEERSPSRIATAMQPCTTSPTFQQYILSPTTHSVSAAEPAIASSMPIVSFISEASPGIPLSDTNAAQPSTSLTQTEVVEHVTHPPQASIAARLTLQTTKPNTKNSVRPLSSLAQSLAHLPPALRPRFATIQIQKQQEEQRLLELQEQSQQPAVLAPSAQGKATFYISNSSESSPLTPPDISAAGLRSTELTQTDHNTTSFTTLAHALPNIQANSRLVQPPIAPPMLSAYLGTNGHRDYAAGIPLAHENIGLETAPPFLSTEDASHNYFSDDYDIETDSNYSDYDENAPTPSSFFEKVMIPPPGFSTLMHGKPRQSQLSVALCGPDFYGSGRSQRRGLAAILPEHQQATSEALETNSIHRIPHSNAKGRHDVPHIVYQRHLSPLSSFVQSELTNSLRQMLAWDHAMPFNTRLTRMPLPHASLHPSDFGQECW
ncbi:hypothetical protein O5D80_006642 [Batrachochytrium dendrobatidis]|nr:hypothetical protein O5D80_006642 [Batrachochytrium dendrobatidis]